VVPFLPAVHQAGEHASLHPVLIAFAGLAIALFFIGYGSGMPQLHPSHGAAMRGFMTGLTATLSVALDQLLEIPAILAFGVLIGQRLSKAAVAPIDGITLLITLACLAVLARRAWTGGERQITVKGSRIDIPRRSAAHHLLDLAYIILGVVLLRIELTAGGIALIAIPAVLITVRLCASSRRHA
jgi:hypothetical protein